MIWLDAARVFSIAAVVVLHVAGSVVVLTDFGSPGWWFANVYRAMVSWCVPVVVMVSGALLLDDRKRESIADFYKKRAARIIPPIVFWSAVYIVWNHRASISGIRVADVVESLARGWPHYHMWFIFMLVCLYLFVPFLRILVSHSRRGDLWLLTALMFFFSGVNEAYRFTGENQAGLFTNWFLSYLPYFLCGHLIRTGKSPLPSPGWLAIGFVAALVATAVGCFVLGRAKGLDWGMYFYGYFSISVVPMSMMVMYWFKSLDANGWNMQWVKALAPSAFGVYLVHPIVLESFRGHVFKPENHWPFASVPLLSVLVCGISLMVAAVFVKVPVLKRVV